MKNRNFTIILVLLTFSSCMIGFLIADVINVFNQMRREIALEGVGNPIQVNISVPNSIKVESVGALESGGFWIVTSLDSIDTEKTLTRYNISGEVVERIKINRRNGE